MHKKLLILSAIWLSSPTFAATTVQQSTANPYQVRAYTRHLKKCQLLYKNCMEKYCKHLSNKKCDLANHCRIEYQKYCVSEAKAIKPQQYHQQSKRMQAQQNLYHAQQACSQQLKQSCDRQKDKKQCTANAAYNECMRAAQRASQ